MSDLNPTTPADPPVINPDRPPVIRQLAATGCVTWRDRILPVVTLAVLAAVFIAAYGNRMVVRNLITNPGFESGVDGWDPSYGWGRLAATEETVHSGQQAIVSVERSAHFCGPAQSLLDRLQPGGMYVCSGWVRVQNGDEEPVKMTVRQRDANGLRYHLISTTSASSNQWHFFSGRFRFQPVAPLQSLAIYFEGPRRGVEFLVDDVRVVPDRFRSLLWPVGIEFIVMMAGVALGLAFKRRWWSVGCGVIAGILSFGLLASWLVDGRSAVVVGPAPDYVKAFGRLGFEKVIRGEALELNGEILEPTLCLATNVKVYANCASDLAIVATTAEIHGRVQGKLHFRGEKITIMKTAQVIGGIESSGKVVQPKVVKAADQEATALVAAANAAARAGEWQNAFESLQQVLAAGSIRETDWSCATASALAAGETNTCLELCRQMMERFGETQDPASAERCAKQCLVLPGLSGELLDKTVERVEFSFNARPNDRWRQLSKGMAEYRQGQWSNALEMLRQPELSSNLEISALAWPFGAMARHQLGDTNAARQALDEADSRLKLILETGKLAKAGNTTWDNYARAFAVHAEAERLILGRETSPPRNNAPPLLK